MNSIINEYKPCNNICPNCGSSNTEYNPSFAFTTYPVQYGIHCKCCDHHFTSIDIIFNTPSEIGKLQTWDPNNQIISPAPDFFTQKGWECPKCGSVMAPFQSYCVFCSNKTSNNTITYSPSGGRIVASTIAHGQKEKDKNDINK